MTVPDRLLQRCAGLLLGLALLFPATAAQAQKVLDPYQIKRTVLSSDGRYMAFDFHKLSAESIQVIQKAHDSCVDFLFLT